MTRWLRTTARAAGPASAAGTHQLREGGGKIRGQGFLSDPRGKIREDHPIDYLVHVRKVALPLYPQWGLEPNVYYIPPVHVAPAYLRQERYRHESRARYWLVFVLFVAGMLAYRFLVAPIVPGGELNTLLYTLLAAALDAQAREPLRRIGPGVAGEDQDGQPRGGGMGAHFLNQFETIHARHVQVGEDERDGIGLGVLERGAM